MRHFPQRHTGRAISLELDGMLEELDLLSDELLKYCVADNASNMKKAIRESRYYLIASILATTGALSSACN